jgi:hypothetical protein
MWAMAKAAAGNYSRSLSGYDKGKTKKSGRLVLQTRRDIKLTTWPGMASQRIRDSGCLRNIRIKCPLFECAIRKSKSHFQWSTHVSHGRFTHSSTVHEIDIIEISDIHFLSSSLEPSSKGTTRIESVQQC